MYVNQQGKGGKLQANEISRMEIRGEGEEGCEISNTAGDGGGGGHPTAAPLFESTVPARGEEESQARLRSQNMYERRARAAKGEESERRGSGLDLQSNMEKSEFARKFNARRR